MATLKEKGGSVSSDAPATTAIADSGKDASALMQAIDKAEPPEVAADDPQDSGQLQLTLSPETLEQMSKELRDALAQIANGFDSLTKPGEIFDTDQSFYVIDAFTIDDFVDQKTGEEKVKHIFRLEFDGGVIRNIMQSDARPRRILAKSFMLARGMGGRLRQGPFKMEKKTITGQIQPAYIFAQQPGFTQRAFQ